MIEDEHPTNNPTIGDWIMNSTLGREYQSRNHHFFQVSLILPVTHRYQEHAKCSFHFQALNIMELRMYICFCPNLLAYISIICSQKARFFGPLASQSESFSSGTMLRLPLSSMTLSNRRDGPSLLVMGGGGHCHVRSSIDLPRYRPEASRHRGHGPPFARAAFLS